MKADTHAFIENGEISFIVVLNLFEIVAGSLI